LAELRNSVWKALLELLSHYTSRKIQDNYENPFSEYSEKSRIFSEIDGSVIAIIIIIILLSALTLG
jgi:hypothetical protein